MQSQKSLEVSEVSQQKKKYGKKVNDVSCGLVTCLARNGSEGDSAKKFTKKVAFIELTRKLCEKFDPFRYIYTLF